MTITSRIEGIQAVDIERVRAETPGCADVVHLNNAGAALQPAPVHDTVLRHLELEARIGGYEAADAVADRLSDYYDVMARLVGAHPDEIAYVDNATRGWDMAFYAIPFRAGDRILTTTSEYGSNGMAYAQVSARHGVRVEVIPDDEHGQVSPAALERMLGEGGVRLVTMNHVPTHDGLINPVAEVGKLTRAAGVLYLVDACQSVGQLCVDVAEIGCDLLSATGRKFLRGPRGTGFLYVRRDVLDRLEPLFVDLRSAEWTGPDSYELRPGARRFETGERFVAGQLGQARAATYAMDVGLEAIEERVIALADRLRGGLAELPGIRVHDRGVRKSAIVTFTHDRLGAAEIAGLLAERHINVRVAEQSYRYDSGHRPPRRVRASVHYYNTGAELDHTLSTLASLL
jgi:cysteine desulfurase/selenocysteine lyase